MIGTKQSGKTKDLLQGIRMKGFEHGASGFVSVHIYGNPEAQKQYDAGYTLGSKARNQLLSNVISHPNSEAACDSRITAV